MDIAKIGFAVDTGNIEKGVNALEKLQQAARGMTTASMKMAAAAEGANEKLLSARANVANASIEKTRVELILDRVKATKSATVADIEAAKAAVKKADADLKAARANKIRAEQASLTGNLEKSLGKTSFSNSSTIVGETKTFAPIARDQLPNRFNTANIAAQFQDIGVTAAMGMNPLLVAIQQGTQLSAIMNSMEKPLQGIGIALRQIFNAVSLLSIGIVALVVAGIQMVDWINVAKGLLNGLATAIQKITPYVVTLGTILAVVYSPVILSGLATVAMSMLSIGTAAVVASTKMAVAWFVALGPISQIIVGLGLVAAAFQMLGIDIFSTMKKAANFIIGAFVGAFNAVRETWSALPSVMGFIVVNTANIVLSGLETMVNGSINMINGLVNALPESLRPKDGLISWRANIQIDNTFTDKALNSGKKAGEEFSKALSKDYIGAAQKAANSFADNIRKYASTLGQEDEKKNKKNKGGKSEAENFSDLERSAQRKLATLKAEQKELTLTSEAASRLKFQTELLNDAQQKKINLDVTDKGQTQTRRTLLMKYADDMASVTEQTKRLREAQTFLNGTFSGFFQDLRQGLQEGKNLWETFGNAVTNVLNKIFDAILNSGVNSLTDALFKSPTGGGAAGSDLLSTVASFLFSAKGNAFGQNGLTPFAKGGAFTNSVVNKATPFAFAGGGKFGVMGEAGPEAVMPLHRGSDGSLGVRMNGSNDNSVIVNINNYGNSNVSAKQRQGASGMEIDVMIDEMISQKIADQNSATSRSLKATNNRQLKSR